MANYYESARTNYFRVKDYAAFEAEIDKIKNSVETHKGEDGRVCLLATDGGWPSSWIDDGGVEHGIDFFRVVAGHLADNSIVVFMGAGNEKLRYVTGYAVAMNNQGEFVQIVLDDIYKEAQEVFGDEAEITLAQY